VLPWQYDINSKSYTWFTPVLGVTMALSLFGFGVGAILWAKLLITEEETVQERHSGRSTPEARATTAAVLTDGIAMTGLPGARCCSGCWGCRCWRWARWRSCRSAGSSRSRGTRCSSPAGPPECG
jgi:hypothetical protein